MPNPKLNIHENDATHVAHKNCVSPLRVCLSVRNATRSSCRITPVCIAEPIRARRLSRSKNPSRRLKKLPASFSRRSEALRTTRTTPCPFICCGLLDDLFEQPPQLVRNEAVWLCTMIRGIAQNDGCLSVASIIPLLYTPAVYYVVTAAPPSRLRDTSPFAEYSATL